MSRNKGFFICSVVTFQNFNYTIYCLNCSTTTILFFENAHVPRILFVSLNTLLEYNSNLISFQA